ncbi:DUF3862 domain-containing protein [Lactobacillus sp. ESL0701]|uniref:DUF3862 domain-containing protein n=1 Tax=Lactobacillus sp. ESL0701 TaxID=2983217 RepID=UPI0023F7D0AB|nr:DUF3862 domain-containing protein [Lactobacillus sp. ESL0701]MDF7672194.1 DUF3862 domain-containing protein [Lactobacillus sp. ESL0701]
MLNKKENAKQPFYKQTWFWLIIVIAFIGLLGITFYAGKKSTYTNNTKTEQKSHKKSKPKLVSDKLGDKTTQDNLTLFQIYTNIKVGDLMQNGQGGSTYSSVKKSLQSDPSEASDSETSGIKTQIAKWEYDDMTLTFVFVNNKVVRSSLTDFRWHRPSNRLTRKAYKKLSNSTTSDEVTDKFGLPDEIDQSLILGRYKNIFTWYTGIKGGVGSEVDLEFTGTRLTGKSENGLE